LNKEFSNQSYPIQEVSLDPKAQSSLDKSKQQLNKYAMALYSVLHEQKNEDTDKNIKKLLSKTINLNNSIKEPVPKK
jgi:menaquinone-dependent protoporphyrinogen IX oxidase